MAKSDLIQKVWSFCNTLRDDGVGYGDYLEQLTFLLFLKIADEQGFKSNQIPDELGWRSLLTRSGSELEAQYFTMLHKLGEKPGMLGAIFENAQNKIQDPKKLLRLIRLIDAERWAQLDTDIKGDLYEGLLQKNAEDTKSGAGQYFTPRPLIQAIVACVRPQLRRTICDPACGTGGFFLAAHEWLTGGGAWLTADWLNYQPKRLKPRDLDFLRKQTFHGHEIVASTRRLCLMNLFLRGIVSMDDEPLVSRTDALVAAPTSSFDYVLANPPFGTRSGGTTSNDGSNAKDTLSYQRTDFWATTSNKQLNFVQHIANLLKPNGQAAIIVPDNVLFAGGPGERIRRELLERFHLHTILRLPTGIFYAQGVKANVLFLDGVRGCAPSGQSGTWIYDLRTNSHHTLRSNPLSLEHLRDFVSCYSPTERANRTESLRFRYFDRSDLLRREKASLDIFWLPDEKLGTACDQPSVDILQQDIIEHLEAALAAFRDVARGLPSN
jgi:type I restriction enzyme M protein